MALQYKIDHRQEKNGLIYTIIDESRIKETTDFFYNYFLTGKSISILSLQFPYLEQLIQFEGEPITQSFGGFKGRNEALDKVIEDCVLQGISVMAVDPATNKMVGMRLSMIMER